MNDTIQDVNALPTMSDDATVKRLNESLEQLAQDEQDVADALDTAREELQDAEADAEDAEIEQYADPDVTESDVKAAQERHEAAKAEVERLETKADRIQQAIERVADRRRKEKDGPAGLRMFDEYATVSLATSERAVEAFEEALEALEAMNTVRRNASKQNVTPDYDDAEPNVGSRYRNADALRNALNDALESAERPIDGLKAYLNG